MEMDERLEAFSVETGGVVRFELEPFLALAVVTACLHVAGHPQMSAHVSEAVWHWALRQAMAFEQVTPHIGAVVGIAAPHGGLAWEAN
jgi:hypothetical protein